MEANWQDEVEEVALVCEVGDAAHRSASRNDVVVT